MHGEPLVFMHTKKHYAWFQLLKGSPNDSAKNHGIPPTHKSFDVVKIKYEQSISQATSKFQNGNGVENMLSANFVNPKIVLRSSEFADGLHLDIFTRNDHLRIPFCSRANREMVEQEKTLRCLASSNKIQHNLFI